MIVIVAFLQCQWFKDAKRAAKIYSLYGKTPDGRAELNGRYLFFRSKTGRVLRECLGQDLCDRIIWEESTTRLADQSTGAFTPDPQHMRVVLDHFRPQIVVAFGKVAQEGLWETMRGFTGSRVGVGFEVIMSPHPTSRGRAVKDEIVSVRKSIEEMCGRYESAGVA